MKKRKIGNLYDKEKFDKAFSLAADRLVGRVMGEYADSDKGREAYREAVVNLNEQLKATPIELYQTLEAYVDGKDISEYVSFSGSEKAVRYFEEQGDYALIDLLVAYKDGSLAVKDPDRAIEYYDGIFKDRLKTAHGVGDISAAELNNIISERLSVFDRESAAALDARRGFHKTLTDEHKSFVAELPAAQGRSLDSVYKRLYREFKNENRALLRLEKRQMRAQRSLIPYSVKDEYGMLDDRGRVKYNKLLKKEAAISGELDCYMGTLDELNEVRLKNGVISARQYYMTQESSKPRSSQSSKDALSEQPAKDALNTQRVDLKGHTVGQTPLSKVRDETIADRSQEKAIDGR